MFYKKKKKKKRNFIKIFLFYFIFLCSDFFNDKYYYYCNYNYGYYDIAYAAQKPNYVGISEGDEYIWKTTFDKGPLENYFEDLGFSESFAENITDWFFDAYDWDDDVVGWKLIIIEIKDEDDRDYNGIIDDEDDVNYVKFKFSIWETEDLTDPNGWDDIDKSEKDIMYESEEIVYADTLLIGFTPWHYWGLGTVFFVPRGLDWGKVVNEVDDWLEDHNEDDELSVSTAKVNFFFQDKEVGVKTSTDFDNDELDDFESDTRYNDNGIMYYWIWTYDGDIIAEFELTTYGQSRVYFIENWWWMSLIAIGVVAGIIVLIVLKLKS